MALISGPRRRTAPATPAPPPVAEALQNALTRLHPNKSGLRSFLAEALGSPVVLSRLDWTASHAGIVDELVDNLVRDQHQGGDNLARLAVAVASVKDFRRLTRLEAGTTTAALAETAVAALRDLVAGEADRDILPASTALPAAAERRGNTEALDRAGLAALRDEYLGLLGPRPPEAPGAALARLLQRLIRSLRSDAEITIEVTGDCHVDGAVTLHGAKYLFLGRWQQHPVSYDQLMTFHRSLLVRPEDIPGLFLAINGFAPYAVALCSPSGTEMILADGSDLLAVLEGELTLAQLLDRKRRHAAETGEIFLPIHKNPPVDRHPHGPEAT